MVRALCRTGGFLPQSRKKCRQCGGQRRKLFGTGFDWKAAFPPERFARDPENRKQEYKKLRQFLKAFSNRTIWNIFWSANNYQVPEKASEVNTVTQFWVGTEEWGSRFRDLKWYQKYLPQMEVIRIPGMIHGEFAGMHPQEFAQKAIEFFSEKERRKDMGVFGKFFNQTRKPEGRLGRIMLYTMNAGHAKMADWGMSHLPQISPEKLAELGCGAGRNAGELLKRYPKAHVTAVDYSPLSVEKAKEYNKAMIASGRCNVLQGDVSALLFSNGSFDLATAFETVYFWPDLERCFSEVYRVLKPGGCFLISNESDGMDTASRKFERIIDGMKAYTAGELETALRAAGFSEVTSDHHQTRPWITVIARK